MEYYDPRKPEPGDALKGVTPVHNDEGTFVAVAFDFRNARDGAPPQPHMTRHDTYVAARDHCLQWHEQNLRSSAQYSVYVRQAVIIGGKELDVLMLLSDAEGVTTFHHVDEYGLGYTCCDPGDYYNDHMAQPSLETDANRAGIILDRMPYLTSSPNTADIRPHRKTQAIHENMWPGLMSLRRRERESQEPE